MKTVTQMIMATSLLAAMATLAHADDKYYPGVMCAGLQPAFYYNTGAILNWNASTTTVTCPLVRDVVRSDGQGWTSLSINVINNSSIAANQALTCTARTFYPDDYAFGAVSANTLGPQTNWSDLSLSSVPAPSPGYLLVSCVLPAYNQSANTASGVASYRIDE